MKNNKIEKRSFVGPVDWDTVMKGLLTGAMITGGVRGLDVVSRKIFDLMTGEREKRKVKIRAHRDMVKEQSLKETNREESFRQYLVKEAISWGKIWDAIKNATKSTGKYLWSGGEKVVEKKRNPLWQELRAAGATVDDMAKKDIPKFLETTKPTMFRGITGHNIPLITGGTALAYGGSELYDALTESDTERIAKEWAGKDIVEKGTETAKGMLSEQALQNAVDTSGITDNFWYGMSVVPGMYVTHKLIKNLEDIAQEKEFQRLSKDIEQKIEEKSKQDQYEELEKDSSYKDYKHYTISEYIRGFNEQLVKIAQEDKELKAKITKSGEHYLGLMNKSANIIGDAWTAGVEAPFSFTAGLIKKYPALLGTLIPLGWLTGLHTARYMHPLSVDEDDLLADVVFEKKKKKKTKKASLEKDAVDASILTQLVGTGYIVDLIRRSLGENYANMFLQQYMDNMSKNTNFNIIQKPQRSKKNEQASSISGIPS